MIRGWLEEERVWEVKEGGRGTGRWQEAEVLRRDPVQMGICPLFCCYYVAAYEDIVETHYISVSLQITLDNS